MNVTAIMQWGGALFIAQLYQIDLTIGAIISVVFTAVVASMGTAGVPGAGIIMLGMYGELHKKVWKRKCASGKKRFGRSFFPLNKRLLHN